MPDFPSLREVGRSPKIWLQYFASTLSIAKKWEIYLPPDKRDEILDLQGRCERNEVERVPGAPTVTTEGFNAIEGLVEKLEKQLAELKRRR